MANYNTTATPNEDASKKKKIEDNPYLNGMHPDHVQFENNAAMVEAMADPRYSKDEDFRELVTHMLRNAVKAEQETAGFHQQATEVQPDGSLGFTSGRQLARAMSAPDEARKIEDQKIFREQSAAMFGDPRYAASPTYRREVENWLKANTPAIDAQLGNTLRDRNATKGAYRIQLGTNVSSHDEIREHMKAKVTQEDADRKEAAKARIDAGESADAYDLGGQKL